MREVFDITVFGPLDTNYESEGLCGPLTTMGEPVVAEEAGGEYCLDLEHPYDPEGKWKYLVPGYTLRAWVQMHTPPDVDDMGSYATTVEVWKVSATASPSDRYLYSTRADGSGTKKLKLMPGGTEATILQAYAEGRWRIKTKYGTGWVNQAGLDGETRRTERAEDADAALGSAYRPQLFDIQKVERNRDGVQVHALHISYRLMKNITRYVATGSVTGLQAAQALFDNCLEPHEFSVHSDIGDTRAGAMWNYVNPIEAIMDPEEGLMARWNAELLRDNFDLFLLHAVGHNQGTVIEVGRNLAGITVTEDWESVATYLMPLGEKADGTVLTLPEKWIVSDRAWNYPQKYIYAFWADDATVDDDNPQSTVLARMRAQAQAMIDGGCDLPALTVEVEVAQVDDPRAQEMIEALEPVLVYDIVKVYDLDHGIELTERVLRREADPVSGRLRRCVLGNSTNALTGSTLASWQIPSGLSGSKIEPGTLDGISLKDKTLYLKRCIAEAITGDLIAGQTITAQHLAAGAAAVQALDAVTAHIKSLDADDVRAGDMTANNLAAALAHLTQVVAAEIRTGSLSADSLCAQMADMVTASIGTLRVGYAQIEDLTAQEAIITDGEAGALLIRRLAVTSANMVNAVIGSLVIGDGEGGYYAVRVGADGGLETENVTVTAEEITAGETADGRQIVATTVNADELNGGTVRADSAILGTVLTTALTAGKITAGEAMLASASIPALYAASLEAIGETLNLTANQSIALTLQTADLVRQWFSFTDEGLIVRKQGSKWRTRTDADGYYIEHDDVAGPVGAFHKEIVEVRGLQVGDIAVIPSDSGGWVWTDA